jgi:phosphoribosylamine--glycine ligase
MARTLPGVNLFHHGTACENGRLITSRGRVLAVTATAHNLPCALKCAYRGVEQVHFAGAQYRRDIGNSLVQLQKPPILGWYESSVGLGTAV